MSNREEKILSHSYDGIHEYEAEGAAGLVDAGAPPDPAAQALVEQPTVDQ